MRSYRKWIGVLLGIYSLIFLSFMTFLPGSFQHLDQTHAVIGSFLFACVLSGPPAMSITFSLQHQTKRKHTIFGSIAYFGGLYLAFTPPLSTRRFFLSLLIIVIGILFIVLVPANMESPLRRKETTTDALKSQENQNG